VVLDIALLVFPATAVSAHTIFKDHAPDLKVPGQLTQSVVQFASADCHGMSPSPVAALDLCARGGEFRAFSPECPCRCVSGARCRSVRRASNLLWPVAARVRAQWR